MDNLGKTVRKAREEKGESPKELAKVLKCSEHFARHIESARSVPISPRLIKELKRHYKKYAPMIEKHSHARNKRGKAYYKSYRQAA